jgi:hypothetical protein
LVLRPSQQIPLPAPLPIRLVFTTGTTITITLPIIAEPCVIRARETPKLRSRGKGPLRLGPRHLSRAFLLMASSPANAIERKKSDDAYRRRSDLSEQADEDQAGLRSALFPKSFG